MSRIAIAVLGLALLIAAGCSGGNQKQLPPLSTEAAAPAPPTEGTQENP